MNKTLIKLSSVFLITILLPGCLLFPSLQQANRKALVANMEHVEWPAIKSSIGKDPMIESKVSAIVAKMTLNEKVGQMIQPNLNDVTPEEAKQYKLGSLLNGGGSWPNDDKHASAKDWVLLADKYWAALDSAYADRDFKVPFIKVGNFYSS